MKLFFRGCMTVFTEILQKFNKVQCEYFIYHVVHSCICYEYIWCLWNTFLTVWLCGQDDKTQVILIITPVLKALQHWRLKLIVPSLPCLWNGDVGCSERGAQAFCSIYCWLQQYVWKDWNSQFYLPLIKKSICSSNLFAAIPYPRIWKVENFLKLNFTVSSISIIFASTLAVKFFLPKHFSKGGATTE